MRLDRSIFSLIFISAWLFSAGAGQLSAQERLVRVSITPDNTQWNWEPYAERLSELFAAEIEKRVEEGIPLREFKTDSSTVAVNYRFSIDCSGNLRRFAQPAPAYRYIAYLIQRTANLVAPFEPLPDNFPLFYFDGTITFLCSFKPTGRYKRLYFEEPLDTVKEASFVPTLKSEIKTPLFMYKPVDMDKKAILEQFKKRIGMVEEISDTSSYTPLDFSGRSVGIEIAYDSLTNDSYQAEWLKRRIEVSLSGHGAHIVEHEYTPPAPTQSPPEAVQEEETAPDSAVSTPESSLDSTITARADSTITVPADSTVTAIVDSIDTATTAADSTAATAADSTAATAVVSTDIALVDSSAATAEDSSLADSSTSAEKAPAVDNKLDELLKRDINKAFAGLTRKDFLIFSAGVSESPEPGKGLCRLRLFSSGRPDDLKRRVDYLFAYPGYLPDSLGEILVRRLTEPPPKPKPLPKPEAPAAEAPSDSATAAKPDSAAATAPADSLAPVLSDSAAAAGGSVDSAAASSAGSVATPADSVAKDLGAASRDTAQEVPGVQPAPPAAQPDSAEKGSEAVSPETTPQAEPDSAAAGPDSVIKTPSTEQNAPLPTAPSKKGATKQPAPAAADTMPASADTTAPPAPLPASTAASSSADGTKAPPPPPMAPSAQPDSGKTKPAGEKK